MVSSDRSGDKMGGVARWNKDDMLYLWNQARIKCFGEIINGTYPSDSKLYCNRTWDDIMCWDFVPAGTVGNQSCPSYVNGFRVDAYALRECGADGRWSIHPAKNRTWTNYSLCTDTSTEARDNYDDPLWDHLPRIKVMYQVGFALSIATLLLAVFIMSFFKKLHCARNTIHLNLFLSFIVRALSLILKDALFIDGMGLSHDLYEDADGTLKFNPNATHWQCKLLITFHWYSTCTNLMWVFVEALYLYLLIFVSVFSERNNTVRYIIFGWMAPLTFIIPWVLVRVNYEDEYCWHLNKDERFIWIIQGPIIIIVVANFFIFLAIVWILFTKLRASNTPEARRYRYRKLARSTLVLIPLFGVYYIFLVWLPVGKDMGNDTVEIAYYYLHTFLDSYQGTVVAFLFCFLNGEVRTELAKKCACQRQAGRGRGQKNTWMTVSTYVSRARTSFHSLQSTVVERSESLQPNGSAGEMTRLRTPPRTPPDERGSHKVFIEAKVNQTGESTDGEGEKLM